MFDDIYILFFVDGFAQEIENLIFADLVLTLCYHDTYTSPVGLPTSRKCGRQLAS